MAIEPKQTRVARLREHRTALNKILRDDRLSPNRRVLAFCLSLWLDTTATDDQLFLRNLMEGVWINPKRWKWLDDEDPQQVEPQSLLEQQAVSKIKGAFDSMIKAETKQ